MTDDIILVAKMSDPVSNITICPNSLAYSHQNNNTKNRQLREFQMLYLCS